MRKLKKHKGFTLAELVVSMVLIVPLITLLVLYLYNIEQTAMVGRNTFQTQQQCQDFTDTIAAEMKMATDMTVSDKTLTLIYHDKTAIYTFEDPDGGLTLTKTTDSGKITVFEPLDDGSFETVGNKAVHIYVRLSPTDKIDFTLHRQDFNSSREE